MSKYIDTNGLSHLGEKIDERIVKRRGVYVVPHGTVTWTSNTEFQTETTDERDVLLNAMRYARLELVIEAQNGDFITLYEYQRSDDSAVVNFKSALDSVNPYLYAMMETGYVYAQISGEIRTDIADGFSDITTLKSEIRTKANIDGSYEGMTVGQLVSSVGIEDQTPYNFRTSGGSTEIGDREEVNAVVGVSVPWNQHCEYNETTPTENWSLVNVTLSISGRKMTITSSSNSTARKGVTLKNYLSTANHKYLVSGYITPDASNNAVYGFYNSGVAVDRKIVPYADGKTDISTVFGISASGYDFEILTANATPSGSSCVAEDVMLIDLTQTFGSTIANYIYALEQNNAGSGVAYFKKLFPKPYYAYNSGSLLSARTNLHRMVGFNQCNDSIHSGHFWTAGTLGTNKGADYAAIDSKIRAIPNTQYCVYIPDGTNGATLTVYLNQWDAGGNYIGTQSVSIGADNRHVFTTAANVAEIAVSFYRSGGATTGERICVNLSWDGERDGEFEPFEAHEYALDDITLRGILKLDANNNLYADGDRYLPDGTVERRYAERAYQSGDESLADAITDGTKTVYKLATPTTETADPYTQTQIVDDFGAEEFVDAAVEANERDVAVPVGNETAYKANLRAKLEMAPDSPDGDGDWIVRQTNGQNAYIPLLEVKELPDMPSEDGSYVLKITVSGGTVTKAWVEEV